MGQIDIATKMFVSVSDIFAQIFNVGLFKGDIVVREDGLTDLNSLEDVRLEGKGKLFEKIRDVKKQSDLGFSLAILGIEDQDKIHQFMPVRTMMYDAAAYEGQFRRIIEECEQKRNYHTIWNGRTQRNTGIACYYHHILHRKGNMGWPKRLVWFVKSTGE